MEGRDCQSTSLLTPETQWESKGLQMEEAVVQPDGELCVSVLIQNPTTEPVCLASMDVLGQMQPIIIMPKPEIVATVVDGDTFNPTEEHIDPNSRDA